MFPVLGTLKTPSYNVSLNYKTPTEVYLHNRTLFSCKKQEILLFAATWMDNRGTQNCCKWTLCVQHHANRGLGQLGPAAHSCLKPSVRPIPWPTLSSLEMGNILPSSLVRGRIPGQDEVPAKFPGGYLGIGHGKPKPKRIFPFHAIINHPALVLMLICRVRLKNIKMAELYSC